VQAAARKEESPPLPAGHLTSEGLEPRAEPGGVCTRFDLPQRRRQRSHTITTTLARLLKGVSPGPSASPHDLGEQGPAIRGRRLIMEGDYVLDHLTVANRPPDLLPSGKGDFPGAALDPVASGILNKLVHAPERGSVI
jgi:hypothetical protein